MPRVTVEEIRCLGLEHLDRRSCVWIVCSYLPAAHSQEEAEDIGLLLLLQLFDVFEGAHLRELAMLLFGSLQGEEKFQSRAHCAYLDAGCLPTCGRW